MIVKILTHMHMVFYTWWCRHICEGGDVWAVVRGLGFALPPAKLASTGFRHFRENKMHIFHCTGKFKKWWKHGSVSWAKTCALVIHIWRVAHKWPGRSSGTRKWWSVAEIHAIDARAGSNRHWRQRLSGYPSSACARGHDRRAVAKAIDAASCIVPASDVVELRGRARAWEIDAQHRVCRPCGIRIWWTRAKTSSLDQICRAYERVCCYCSWPLVFEWAGHVASHGATDVPVASVGLAIDATVQRLSPPKFAQWRV
jgi:hypothetical protein